MYLLVGLNFICKMRVDHFLQRAIPVLNCTKHFAHLPPVCFRSLSTSSRLFALKDFKSPWDEVQIMKWKKYFETGSKSRTKEEFIMMIQTYMENVKTIRGGKTEFILSALRMIGKFEGAATDKEVYKMLIRLYPEKIHVPTNVFQVGFFHMPRQNECAQEILETMGRYGVMPDREIRDLILKRFGDRSKAFAKYARQIYWIQKFNKASPFPLPNPVPKAPYELALLAIQRICVDLRNEITVYQTSDIEESKDKTWIVGGQSPDQRDLLAQLPNESPVFVEGPHIVWLRNQSVSYFVLRAEPKAPQPEPEVDEDDVSDMKLLWFGEKPGPKDARIIAPIPSVHEQDDGIYLALCATGTSSRDSLLSWIRFLQFSNPHLANLTVVFTLKAPFTELSTPANLNPEACQDYLNSTS